MYNEQERHKAEKLFKLKQQLENRAYPNGRIGVRGVTWESRGGKWRAQIQHNGKMISLGRFDNLDDAAEAARAARIRLFTHNDDDHAGVS